MLSLVSLYPSMERFTGTWRAATQEAELFSLTETLRSSDRLPPSDAESFWAVKKVRSLLKKGASKLQQKNLFQIERTYLAFKLGIKEEALEKNEDFALFAKREKLDRYLSIYNHTILVSDKQEISLLCEGVYTPWSKLSERFFQEKRPKMQPWSYGQHGFQDLDMLKWRKLSPFKVLPPEKREGCKLEILVSSAKDSVLVGTHSWIRITSQSGKVYSIGKYRPFKKSFFSHFYFPFREKKGLSMQPDVSEFWPCPIKAAVFTITKEQYKAIKEMVIKDKKETYQVHDRGCVAFCLAALSLINVKPKLGAPSIYLILPNQLIDFLERSIQCVPRFLSAALKSYAIFSINLLQYYLGAGIGGRPYMRKFSDLFDEKKAMMKHPRDLEAFIDESILSCKGET